MTTKHTPAPWDWDWGHTDMLFGNGNLARLKESRENETYDVCFDAIIETDNRQYGPNDADAALISAAPELLEFAQQIFNAIDTNMLVLVTPADETLENVMHRARLALFKATGERSPATNSQDNAEEIVP